MDKKFELQLSQNYSTKLADDLITQRFKNSKGEEDKHLDPHLSFKKHP